MTNNKPEKSNNQKAPEGTVEERNSRHRSENYRGSAAKNEEDTHKQEGEKKSGKDERKF